MSDCCSKTPAPNPLFPPTITLSCREVPRPLPLPSTRSTFCFDLSGVAYKSRAEVTQLKQEWDTFERIENLNSGILFQLGQNPPPNLRFHDDSIFVRPSSFAEKLAYTKGQLAHIARYPDISDFIVPYSNRPIPYASSIVSSIFKVPEQSSIVASQIIPVATDYATILENRKSRSLFITVSTFNFRFPKSQYKFSSQDEYLLYKKYRDTVSTVSS